MKSDIIKCLTKQQTAIDLMFETLDNSDDFDLEDASESDFGAVLEQIDEMSHQITDLLLKVNLMEG